ncbi:ankyrin repeat-containing domain protein [Tribonema minus]|uniref:Ankyrin repeat-containing domain protein n=1 Tax=Tribonema minus TaxID=303371 RepID=A0A835YWF3_9STRA|nr:ankyrin repeat-containing domain protein [Tribonema minus]
MNSCTTDASGGGGWSALHHACDSGVDDPELIQTLLSLGVDMDARDYAGRTPLAIASRAGHVKAARALLDAGADAAVRDVDGRTPLHYAALRGHRSVIAALARHGGGGGGGGGGAAAVAAVDVQRETPLFAATRGGHAAAAAALVRCGADARHENCWGEQGGTLAKGYKARGGREILEQLPPDLILAISDNQPLVIEVLDGGCGDASCSSSSGSDDIDQLRRWQCTSAGVEFLAIPTFRSINYLARAGGIDVSIAEGGTVYTTDMLVVSSKATECIRMLLPMALSPDSPIRCLEGPVLTIFSTNSGTWLMQEGLFMRMASASKLLENRRHNDSCTVPWREECTSTSAASGASSPLSCHSLRGAAATATTAAAREEAAAAHPAAAAARAPAAAPLRRGAAPCATVAAAAAASSGTARRARWLPGWLLRWAAPGVLAPSGGKEAIDCV